MSHVLNTGHCRMMIFSNVPFYHRITIVTENDIFFYPRIAILSPIFYIRITIVTHFFYTRLTIFIRVNYSLLYSRDLPFTPKLVFLPLVRSFSSHNSYQPVRLDIISHASSKTHSSLPDSTDVCGNCQDLKSEHFSTIYYIFHKLKHQKIHLKLNYLHSQIIQNIKFTVCWVKN